MSALRVLRAHRVGRQWLVLVDDGAPKGEEEMEGINPNKIYDFSEAYFTSAIALTNKDDRRERAKVTEHTKQKLIDAYGLVCTYCFKDLEGEEYHVDHIMPIVFGGTSNIGNLALACIPCNLEKSSKLFPNLAAARDYLRSAS